MIDELSPFQGFNFRENGPTQAVGLGWLNIAPLGLKSQLRNLLADTQNIWE